MILSWTIITKGDEELSKLKGAVASIEDHVDEIIITANGKETKKTEEYCKKHPKIKYTYLKWNNDFGEQRNFCALHVRSDADFYGWMDSDDVVVGADLLREVAQTAKQQELDVVFFHYWYGNKFNGKPSVKNFVEVELEQKRERLIKPGTVRWQKRIHETPVPIDGENFRYTRIPYSKQNPIVWMHLGADRDMSQKDLDAKMQRNKRLLEMELRDEREKGEADPRTILYLMKIYAELPNKQLQKQCIELGKEYLEKSGWDEERAVCLQLMSRCLGKLGLHEEARDLLLKAIKEYPYIPLLYLHLARVYSSLKNYRAMKHWMKIGMSLDLDETNSTMSSILELKVLSAELMLKYYMEGERNIHKALESAQTLNKVNPNDTHQKNVFFLQQLADIDNATGNAHKLMDYLKENGHEDSIGSLYEMLPLEIRRLPFMTKYYNRFKTPRVWGEDEICYFANFGRNHFEKWDGNSLKSGIGGSETAVIRLSEEWVKLGYKVTVYGDPVQECEINGVKYMPFYAFPQRDSFNIFIQWRHNSLAGRVKAKRFLVDLHDVFFPELYEGKTEHFDKLMVKSNFHRDLGKNLPNEKFEIISNGI